MRTFLTTMSSILLVLITSSFDANSQRRSLENNHVAGDFDYYVLAISWSPTHCANQRRGRYDPQCDLSDGKRYSFVLHGLWPQYNRGFPNNCRIGKRPFVPNRVIDFMQDIMPSRRLTIHQYKKHGTCSGLTPRNYFALSRRLFRGIRIPPRYITPQKNQFVSPQQLKTEFLELNPQLRPNMIAVSCGRAGNRLREIRICFTPKGAPRACGSNENQRRLCRAARMFVPPVRPERLNQQRRN